MVIHVKRAGYLPPQRWQLCRVIGGSFRVKWVATLPCNRWQLYCEICIDGKNRRMPVELTGLWLVKWLPIDGVTNSSYSCKIIGRILPANSLFNNKQIDLGCSLSVWR